MPCSPLSPNINIPNYLKKIIRVIEVGKDSVLKRQLCKLKSPQPQENEQGCIVPVKQDLGNKSYGGLFPFCWTFLPQNAPNKQLLVGPGTNSPLKLKLLDVMNLYWNSVNHSGLGSGFYDRWGSGPGCCSPTNPPPGYCGACALKGETKNLKRCSAGCNENNMPLMRYHAELGPESHPYIVKGVPTKKHLVFFKTISLVVKLIITAPRVEKVGDICCGCRWPPEMLDEYGNPPPPPACPPRVTCEQDTVVTALPIIGGFFGENTIYENQCLESNLLQTKNYYTLEGGEYFFYPAFGFEMGSYWKSHVTLSPGKFKMPAFGSCGDCPADVKGVSSKVKIGEESFDLSSFIIDPKILKYVPGTDPAQFVCGGNHCASFSSSADLKIILDEKVYGG